MFVRFGAEMWSKKSGRFCDFGIRFLVIVEGMATKEGRKKKAGRNKREETPKEAARGPQMRPPEVLKGEREADRRLESLHFKG